MQTKPERDSKLATDANPPPNRQPMNEARQDPNETKKKKKKKKKRIRGAKPKHLVVASLGQLPTEKKLRDGKVREYDILRPTSSEHKLPRKTREMLARIALTKSNTNPAQSPHTSTQKPRQNAGNPAESSAQKAATNSNPSPNARKEVSGAGGKAVAVKAPEKKKFEGKREGETYAQFTARLRRESKQMILAIAKKGNHQREKKRAFYERKKERIERRKRRRRGEYSDSEVEEDEGEYQEIAHLPTYWQEVLRNNGRPVSAKRRKRLQRMEAQEIEQVPFGEQVERPPQLTARPKVRGQR